MIKSEELARRWMPGHRQHSTRLAWEHPQDLVTLLNEYPRMKTATIVHVCWLHDIIEDGQKEDGSPVTSEDLVNEGFNLDVVASVVSLTHRKDEDKPTYLARLRDNFPGYTVRVVKSLDRICNLREGAPMFKNVRWARYVNETRDYILPLTDTLPIDQRAWLRERLELAMNLREYRA